jgi:hypothetical protein
MELHQNVIREIVIAKSLNLPSLIVADPRIRLDRTSLLAADQDINHALPSSIKADPDLHLLEDLTKSAILLEYTTSEDQIARRLEDNIEDLGYDLKTFVHSPSIFLGTEISETKNQIMKEHIERIGGMPCIIGDRLGGEHVQELIAKKIGEASVVIADLSENNLNTHIEAGIAIGAMRRLYLIARGERRSPAFMFRDREVEPYSDDTELLGILHRIVYTHRRRIMNYELS